MLHWILCWYVTRTSGRALTWVDSLLVLHAKPPSQLRSLATFATLTCRYRPGQLFGDARITPQVMRSDRSSVGFGAT